MNLAELEAQVAARYLALGLPDWPDPHPGHGSPSEEEYSRVTDPRRYRIVHARARCWADALRELPDVDVESVPPAGLEELARFGPYERGVRISSERPGTLPLWLLEQEGPVRGQPGSLAALHVCVVRPDVVREIWPDCGCDACDSGSADLLRAVDESVGQVVGGPSVVLRHATWHATWYGGRGGSGGTGRRIVNHRSVMELCRRLAAGETVQLPRGVQAWVGRPWLD